MGRFTPGIQRKGGLAQALQQGVQGYQEGQDRELRRDLTMANEGRTARASELSALEKGWRPDLGGALMQAPQFEPNAPGDFNRYTKSFTQIPINPTESVQMQSGGVWNPALPRDQKVQDTMALGGAKIELGGLERQRLNADLGGAVEAVGGPSGAGMLESSAADWLGRPPSQSEPLVAVEGPDGVVRYALRSEAAGAKVGKVATPTNDRVSVSVQKDLKDIEFASAGIERAISLIEGNPSAFGLKNILGPTIVDRLDPDGIQARSAVENIVSTIRHSLYGAALTRPEIQRALTNLPDVKNNPKGAITRLRELAVMLEQERGALARSSVVPIPDTPAQIAPKPSGTARPRVADFLPPED